ncbi:hypothetical protein NECID01_0074 [Nematocida sp. AWRm77]|nr:hypothetical protein NECID01_0074 [Nematocida sp. AWRm77]
MTRVFRSAWAVPVLWKELVEGSFRCRFSKDSVYLQMEKEDPYGIEKINAFFKSVNFNAWAVIEKHQDTWVPNTKPIRIVRLQASRKLDVCVNELDLAKIPGPICTLDIQIMYLKLVCFYDDACISSNYVTLEKIGKIMQMLEPSGTPLYIKIVCVFGKKKPAKQTNNKNRSFAAEDFLSLPDSVENTPRIVEEKTNFMARLLEEPYDLFHHKHLQFVFVLPPLLWHLEFSVFTPSQILSIAKCGSTFQISLEMKNTLDCTERNVSVVLQHDVAMSFFSCNYRLFTNSIKLSYTTFQSMLAGLNFSSHLKLLHVDNVPPEYGVKASLDNVSPTHEKVHVRNHFYVLELFVKQGVPKEIMHSVVDSHFPLYFLSWVCMSFSSPLRVYIFVAFPKLTKIEKAISAWHKKTPYHVLVINSLPHTHLITFSVSLEGSSKVWYKYSYRQCIEADLDDKRLNTSKITEIEPGKKSTVKNSTLRELYNRNQCIFVLEEEIPNTSHATLF